MEHFYRIAFWMFCFIAYIQATPIPQFSVPTEDDLRLDSIKDAQCGNATFLSQSSEEADNSVSIKCIIHELKRASANCTQSEDISDIAMLLEDFYNLPPAPTNSSNCKWETRKPFNNFVEDAKSFFQKLEESTRASTATQ